MGPLPASATRQSRLRFDLARQLAHRCPSEFGREIALTGSAARGVADDYSDIELNLWADAIPSAEARLAWLRQIGAKHIVVDREEIADGSVWTDFRFRSIPVEAGWQTIANLDRLLGALLAGEVTGHSHLVVASTIQRAIPLRTEGPLAFWQERLAIYPECLAERLIAGVLDDWALWHFPQDRFALAARGDHVALAQELVWDVQHVMRILFALNREWEPEWKWLPWSVRGLEIRPPDLLRRITAIFSLPRLEDRVRVDLALIDDTLNLLGASWRLPP